jgi:Uncharacterized conserved protein
MAAAADLNATAPEAARGGSADGHKQFTAVPLSSHEEEPSPPHFADAADVLAHEFSTLMDPNAIAALLAKQQLLHAQITQASHSLAAFNTMSAARYKELKKAFAAHQKCLRELQRDLEYVFRKLRKIREKIEVAQGVR